MANSDSNEIISVNVLGVDAGLLVKPDKDAALQAAISHVELDLIDVEMM